MAREKHGNRLQERRFAASRVASPCNSTAIAFVRGLWRWRWDDAINDTLRLLPRDTTIVLYIDLAALYYDEDLRPIRRDAENEWENLADFEDNFNVRLQDLKNLVDADIEGWNLFVLGGLEHLDGLRDELDDLDYDEDEIRGVEVWLDGAADWEALAFLPGGVVLAAENQSTMEDVPRRRDSESSSKYDEVGDIVSDFPDDILVRLAMCHRGRGCLLGIGLQKKGSDEMTLVNITLFEDEEDAEDAEEDRRDDIEDDDFPHECGGAAVDRSGLKVPFEIVCEMDSFNSYVNFHY